MLYLLVLVYKLLASCPVNKIYLLIRPQKDITAEQRLIDFTSQELFEYLPDKSVFTKLVAIKGDIGEPRLGMSEQDELEIIKNVSIVFHSAATIRFNAYLK